jgi:hypothetical protein
LAEGDAVFAIDFKAFLAQFKCGAMVLLCVEGDESFKGSGG